MKKIITLNLLLLFSCFISAQVSLIPAASTWKYLDNGTNPGTSWQTNGFNDSGWSSGASEFGYGDGDETTVVNACGTVTTYPSCTNKYITTYFRKSFSMAGTASYTAYTASFKRDDGIVLYMNGVEVYRNNMPSGTITYSTPATAAASDDGATFLTATIPTSIITTGTNVIAAEIHQNAGTSSDLTFELSMVGNTISVNAATVSVFPYGSPWKYLDDGTDQSTGWVANTFNDVTWASGNSEFGYGDGDETTVVNACGTTTPNPACTNKYLTTYFRKTFSVTTIPSYTAYGINLRRDDGVILYMNGTEIYRNNMPTGSITYTTLASTNCSDDGGAIFNVTIPSSVIVTGTNVIAAEIHQTSGNSSDLTFEINMIAITNSVAPIVPAIVKGPYLQVGTQNSMIIRWESNYATDTKVMFGTNSASLSTTVTNTVSLTSHEIQITGLSAYTKYFYNIGSTTLILQGDTNNYFVTSPTPGTAGKYRFWVVGDCGNTSTNQTNVKNQYKLYNGNKTTDGWLLLGDNAYSSGTQPEFNTGFFNVYQNDVMKNKVLWPSPGNHDYSNGASTATTVPYFSIFNTPANAEAGGVPSGNKAYYSYDYGNIHFISLDSYGTVSGNKMYDTLGAQAVWLKQDLAANTKKWTIAYWHHPPYTMGSHNSDTEGDLVNIRQRFIKILERNKVDLIMCGHSHDYERSKMMNGHYGNEASYSSTLHALSSSSAKYDNSTNSCPYEKDSTNNKIGTVYVVSGSAGQLGGQQTAFPHNSMHYSNSTNGGSFIIDIEDNKLEGKWLCADGVIRDNFTIFKDVNSVKNYTVLPTQITTLTASWPGNYVWSNALVSASIAVTPTSNSVFWVKDPNSCVADTFVFKVLPAVNFTAAVPFCAGRQIQFSDLSTNSVSAWSWSVNPSTGVTISNNAIQNPGITFNTNGLYTVSLIADNAYGSGSVYTRTILINANPNVMVINSSSAICVGESATLTASGANTYLWNNASVTASTVISPLTTSPFTVTGTDLNGCYSIVTPTMLVNPLPVVTILTPSNIAACAGISITFNGAGALTYTWSGGITNGISFAPSTGNNYTVTGTDLNGCRNTAVSSVTIYSNPVLTTATNPTNAAVCFGSNLTLNASGANTYTWSGGAVNGVPFVPSSNNTYSVTGTDLNGCTGTAVKSITVNALPVLSISGSSAICAGTTLNLSVTGAQSYTWSNNSTTTLISVSPLANSFYTVIGQDQNGCINTSVKAITVNNLPIITINSGVICPGYSFTLAPAGASTYTISGGSNIVSPANTSTYLVSGTSSLGCLSSVAAISTVNVVNSLTLNVSGQNAVCVGKTVSLTANGANSYTWNTGIVNQVLTVNPSSNSNYTVTGSTPSCSNTAVFSITVNPLPIIIASTTNTMICIGESVNLMVSGASTYTWSTAQAGTIITVSPLVSTTYSVNGANPTGCSTSGTVFQKVDECSGISKINSGSDKMLIYPNPNGGTFYTENTATGTSELEIFDATGRKIYSKELISGLNMLSPGLTQGIYLYKIVNNNTVISSGKLVIN